MVLNWLTFFIRLTVRLSLTNTYNKLMKMSCLLVFILKSAWQKLRGSISSSNFFSLTSCSPINSHPPCLASFISFNDVISLTNGILPTQCELLLLSWSNDRQGWFVVCIELHPKKKKKSSKCKDIFFMAFYIYGLNSTSPLPQVNQYTPIVFGL